MVVRLLNVATSGSRPLCAAWPGPHGVASVMRVLASAQG